MKQRMRRISALLLVALMCVSCMVPAFAAESEGCPGAEMTHTKSNCDYKQIGEPHEAACGEQGYTAYQCNECGTYFADDFVPSKGEHAYQLVMQKPTCTEDGFTKMVCLNCGDEDVVDGSTESELKATGHNWVAKNGENCDEGVVCSVCGEAAKEIDDSFHVWGEPELKSAPTHNKNNEVKKGSAKFTCEVCGETKTVDVYCSKDCVFVADAKKDATCTEEGYWPGATCTICGKEVHIIVDGDNVTYKEHDEDDEDCCEHAPYEEIEIIECIGSEEWIVELPTCTKAGQAYKICVMCGEVAGTPVTLDALGHVYQTKVYEVATTGGMTANEIALYAALAAGATEGSTFTYDFIVDGEVVIGTATVPSYILYGSDDEPTAGTATANDDSATTETKYVWTGEYQNDDPLSQDANGQDYMHWADGCSSTTAHSYYTYVCIECDHSEPTVSFTGHYWKYIEAEHEDPDCASGLAAGQDVWVCQNPNCDGVGAADVDDEDAGISYTANTNTAYGAEGAAVKTVEIPAEHTFEKKTVAPTCVSKGYSIDLCKLCQAPDLSKAAEGYGANDEPTDGIPNGAYDIVAVDLTAHAPENVWIKEVTCETDGLKNVVCTREGCKNPNLELSVIVDALGHEADLDAEPLSTTPASCESAGYKYYPCVNGCTKPVEVEVEAKKDHQFNAQETVAPDCSKRKPGYTIIKCKNCGLAAPDQANPTEFDANNPDHHTAVSVLSVTAGNCLTLDTVVRECLVCEKIWTREEDYVGNYKGVDYVEGTGAGHTFEEVDAEAPTCVEDGIIEHYECSVCGQLAADAEGTTLLTEEDIVAKKLTEDGVHPEDKFVYSDEVPATCTTKGHTAGTKCTLCNTILEKESTIDKLGHDMKKADEEHAERDASCTEWGYLWQQCSRCDYEELVNYEGSFGGHKTETVKGYHETCCSAGLTDGERCTVCLEWVVEQEVIAKAPHVNADGEEFYGICTDTVEDRVCVACEKGEYTYVDAEGKTVKVEINCMYWGEHDHTEDIVKDGVVLEEDTVGFHSWTRTEVPATCMSYSYVLVVCEHCGYNYMEGEGFEYADEHLYWGEWQVTKPATTIEEGLKVRECACGEKEEVVIPALAGLEIEVELENGVKPGYVLPDNGKINLVVNTNASDLDVWGIRVELKYSGNVRYNGIVSKSAKFTENGVVVHVDETTNTIMIVATAPNGADGKVANVNLDGLEELITLQFALDDADLGETFAVRAGTICEVNDKDRNLIGVTNTEGASISVEAESGNVIVDNKLDIEDAKALMLFVTGEAEDEYNSAADMNQDGEVTATDFSKLLNELLKSN